MPKEKEGPVSDTQDEDQDTGTQDDGDKNPKQDSGDGEPETMTKAEAEALADRRVQQAVATAAKKAKAERETVEQKVRREMQEARLLEDKNFQKLAELKEEEAKQATAKLEQYERERNILALLDKKKVLDPRERALFLAIPGELTELDERIDGFLGIISDRVQAEVSARMDSRPPPKGAGESRELTPAQKIPQVAAAAFGAPTRENVSAYLATLNAQQEAASKR